MDFSKINFGVDGDSITAWKQWSWEVYTSLNMATHHNVAVGSAVWYKRTVNADGTAITTQDYNSPDFAGISDGWEPTDDKEEIQRRMNNCAVVHIQQYISDIKNGIAPKPDIFAFAMGTNDDINCLGNADTALTGKSLENNENVNLFCEAGAMRWCIQRIMEEFPDARVFVLTPLQTANPEHNKKTEIQIETVMKKVAGAMGAQVIDCYHNCGICEKFEKQGEHGRYLLDGLHPDTDGQQLQGRYVAKEIRNNYF